jgi:hypothetical protein
VVINGQIVTSGGGVVTLAGSNNVVTFGASGLVVQFPSGTVSTFALPTSAPGVGEFIGTVAGIPVSSSARGSVVWIGSKPVTQGGSVVTISGSDVVSLGPSGLEIMIPGGSVSTLSLTAQQAASTAVSASSPGTTSSKNLGSIIASSMSPSHFFETLLIRL